MYTMSKAVEAVFNILERRGLITRLPFGDAVMFSATLAMALAIDRSDFKPAYKSLIDFMFGKQHLSTEELANQMQYEMLNSLEESAIADNNGTEASQSFTSASQSSE